jgi:hypothetical protein
LLRRIGLTALLLDAFAYRARHVRAMHPYGGRQCPLSVEVNDRRYFRQDVGMLPGRPMTPIGKQE